MECILWNKKKTPDYKCTFLGEEPILFVGELFDNSSCLVTDANNNNKPVEDYEYSKIEHAIRGDEEVESISFVEIYQQKYATGKLDLSNYVYDNKNNCNVYYNGELLDPDTTNQVSFNSSNFDKNKLEIVVTRFIDSNSAIYPTNNIIWSFSENESTKTRTLILQTITGVYLGKNGSEGFSYQSPKNYIEVPKLKNNSPSYTGKNLNESILPDNLDTDNINYLIKNASGESIENIIEAGDYQIIFSLKDKVSNAWKIDENTISTKDQISSCKVEKKQIDISCNESLEVILNPNSSVTKNITLSETLNNLTFSISNSGLSYITAKQENEKIIFSSQDFTVDTATTTIYVELNMNNYQSNRLGFQIKLSLFNWEKATWSDLKELCKKGNLENNSGLVLGASKNIVNDLNAILIYKNQKTMVFALPVLNDIRPTDYGPLLSPSKWYDGRSSESSNGDYQVSLVRGYCRDRLPNYLEKNNKKDFLDIIKNTTVPYYAAGNSEGEQKYNTVTDKFFVFSGLDLSLENGNFEQSTLINKSSLLTNPSQIKTLIFPNIEEIHNYGFWLRDAQFRDSNRLVTRCSNSLSLVNLTNSTDYMYHLFGFIIDGEEETANG